WVAVDSRLREFLADLAVLNHVWLAVLTDNQSDALVGGTLAHNLRCEVGAVCYAEANECRVGNLDERVVHAVGMDVLNPTLAHVFQCSGENEGLVDASVAVWRN